MMQEDDYSDLLELGLPEDREFFEMYQQHLIEIFETGEETLSRKTYDALMSTDVYKGEKSLLEDGLFEVTKDLGIKLGNVIHVYSLERGRIDTFPTSKIDNFTAKIDDLDGFNEFVFFDSSTKWLVFYDHYDNCKYHIVDSE